LTVRQAAEALGVGRSRVQALIQTGRLPAQKFGMQYLIDPADLAKVRDRKPGRPKNADAPTAARRATLRKVGMPTTTRRKGKGK
jgi:excisionase family DNA binding protein